MSLMVKIMISANGGSENEPRSGSPQTPWPHGLLSGQCVLHLCQTYTWECQLCQHAWMPTTWLWWHVYTDLVNWHFRSSQHINSVKKYDLGLFLKIRCMVILWTINGTLCLKSTKEMTKCGPYPVPHSQLLCHSQSSRASYGQTLPTPKPRIPRWSGWRFFPTSAKCIHFLKPHLSLFCCCRIFICWYFYSLNLCLLIIVFWWQCWTSDS